MEDIEFYLAHPADVSSIMLILFFSINKACQEILRAIALARAHVQAHARF